MLFDRLESRAILSVAVPEVSLTGPGTAVWTGTVKSEEVNIDELIGKLVAFAPSQSYVLILKDKETGARVELRGITNTGGGISDDHRRTVFDRTTDAKKTRIVSTDMAFIVESSLVRRLNFALAGGNDSVEFVENALYPAITDLPATFSGGNGSDTLVIGAAGGTLLGGAGDDVLDARAAKRPSSLAGGDGDDLLMGGLALDTLFGNAGLDRLDGGNERAGVPISRATTNRATTNRANYPYPVSPTVPTTTPRGLADILDGGANTDTAVFDPADIRTSIERLVGR